MIKTGRLSILLVFFFLSGLVSAQEIKVVAEVSESTIDLGESIQINYKISSQKQLKGVSLSRPDCDCMTFKGESSSNGYQSSTINGKTVAEYVYNYTVRYKSKQVGNCKIPSIIVHKDSKEFKSKDLNIHVNPAATLEQKVDHFLKLSVSDSKVVVGEPLVVSIEYFTVNNFQNFRLTNIPEFKGFIKKDLNVEHKGKRKVIEGKQYNTGVVASYLLIPITAGSHKISDLKASWDILGSERVNSFGGLFQTTRTVIKGEANVTALRKTITVSELPNNAATNFSNAIGDFKFDVSIDKTEVLTNDAITLRLKVSGKGNIGYFDLPDVKIDESFELYDPKTDEKTSTNASGISGSITKEYIMIPREPGEFEIPEINFSFYDYRKKKYISKSFPATKITVNGDPSTLAQASPIKEKNDSEDVVNEETSNTTTLLVSLVSVLILIFGALLFVLLRKKGDGESRAERKQKAKKINALKEAKKRLKNVDQFVQERNDDAFHAEIINAIHGYLRDKFKLNLAELNKESIIVLLEQKGVAQDSISSIIRILNQSEMARYTPVSEPAQNIYNELLNLITDIESSVS